MNVIDSSGWLEYFADGPNAGFFADAIEDTEHLIVPVITIYEVFKRILQQREKFLIYLARHALAGDWPRPAQKRLRRRQPAETHLCARFE